MPTENELISSVDALLGRVDRSDLPEPGERRRLRETAGLTQTDIAAALGTRRETVASWESGRNEPRPPQRAAYARLLEGLAARFPAPGADPDPGPAVPETPAPAPAPAPVAPSAPAAVEPPARTAASSAGPASVPRRPGAGKTAGPAAKKAAASAAKRAAGPAAAGSAGPPTAAVDPRFANGPLAVVDCEDGQVSAYCVGGLVLDVPARSLPALVDWTITEARLGQARLHRNGRDADPVLVLTPAALEAYGLPAVLSEEERRAGRLPEGHKAVRQIKKAGLQLTRLGFGPWARIYRDPEGSRRRCVQVCIPSWNALDAREWDDRDHPRIPSMHPADLARYLATYARLVITPRGTASTTGLELMSALRPPTRAEKNEASGEFERALNPDALTAVYEHVECEVPDEHPMLKGRFERHHLRTPAEMLMEEPYDWCRPLTDDECMLPYLVAVDVNMSFAAAANGLTVGLGAPTHQTRPAFDPKLPGSWLVDLSRTDPSRVQVGGHTVDAGRLPSPFTPRGEHPAGPAWYATPTLAYAQELGFEVAPIEAHVRLESGRYLDPWYQRLRDAYVTAMAGLGVTTTMGGQEFLDAMARSGHADPVTELLAKAVKATAKGGIGKLRQRSRGQVPFYEPWPALARETWRPDIRAAVLANQRIGIHRKLLKTAAAAGVYPVAIGTDAIVYPSTGPSPLDVLPHTDDGRPVAGTFRLGISPGMVKHQGTRSVLWAEAQFEEAGTVFNLANLIKGTAAAGEEE